MATLPDRVVDSSFSSLTATGVVAIVFLSIGFSLEEVLKRLRRYPEEDEKRLKGEQVKDRGSEGWAMGYLYRARTYIPFSPTIDYDNIPLHWMYSAVRLKQSFFEVHAGPDATSYIRFLRGCFYWLLLQTFTVFPLLISINFTHSDIAASQIERASLSSLITSEGGENLLWIHVVCIWFTTLTWYGTLSWIGYGAVRTRRNVLRSLLRGETYSISSDTDSKRSIRDGEKEVEGIEDRPLVRKERETNLQAAEVGWRFRTVLMRNLPLAMRSEAQIRAYFQLHLREEEADSTPRRSSEYSTLVPSTPTTSNLLLPPAQADSPFTTEEQPLIVNVVLARKHGELNELFTKYTDVLHRLETAHCALASNVMEWVAKRVKEEEEEREGNVQKRSKFFKRSIPPVDLSEEDTQLINTLRPFLTSSTAPPTSSASSPPPSIWVTLHSLSPHLLDRFQPLFKLKRFRGQSVPSIDYYLTKLNLLTSLIEDKRSRPLESEAGSSAFVTFGTAQDARRARNEMRVRPGANHTSIKSKRWTFGRKWGLLVLGKNRLGLGENKLEMAPECRDLDWNRLVYVSLSSDILRGLILNVFIWAATIFWVIPITFLVGLLSLTQTSSPSIAKYIPELAEYLKSHAFTLSLFSNLLPAAIVALLSMLVPTLIGMLSRNGQAFFSVSKLHAQVQSRYYKWLIFNIVIVFCVGITAFTSFLESVQSPESILGIVAEAFPKGATFFVSWSLLVIGIHHGIETSLFGIPFINHATIRKLRSPRKREAEALPRSFSYFYWLPNHLLVLGVTAIFAILNPLVIPFNLAYFSFAVVVFKNQFAHVYWRRWYELNGRVVFRRAFRYSLDLFMVAGVVAIALFYVLKLYKLASACLLLVPLTAFFKLIGTRYFYSLMNEIDEAEIDIVCGNATTLPVLSVPLTEKDLDVHHLPISEALGSLSTFARVTLPALTFRPHSRLPSVPSPHTTADPIRPRSESQPLPPSNLNTPHYRSTTSVVVNSPSLGSFLEIEGDVGFKNEKSAVAQAQFQPKLRTTFTPLPRSPMNLSAVSTFTEYDQDLNPLITPHPPVIRDDRPVTDLKYDNPAVVVPLTRSLWLPRDPLVPLDLGDTVDYYGTALVSSEGGRGVIGSWDEFLSEDLEPEGQQELRVVTEAKSLERDTRPKRSSSNVTMEEIIQHRLHRSSTLAGIGESTLDGTERIRVAGEVATKIEAEEAAAKTLPFGTSTLLRRNTGTSSVESGSFFPMMRRRGTGASSLGTGGGSSPGVSPSVAPANRPLSLVDGLAVVRHPFAVKPTSPRIPSFTTSGPIVADEITSDPLPIDSFPPLPSTATTLLTPRNFSSPASLLHPPRSPSHTPIADLPRNFSSSFIRPARSPRIASSPVPDSIRSQHSQIDVQSGRGTSTISQSTALREELWAEEKEERSKRQEKELKRSEQETSDSKGGWFTRYLLGQSEEEEVGPVAQDQ